MGYRIVYTPQGAIKRRAKWPAGMKSSLIIGLLMGSALGIHVFFPELVANLQQALLPKLGVVEAFCQELLHGT